MPATLAEGSTGKQVKKLQVDLNKVLSLKLKTTGRYDDKTKDAVIKFQKKAGLTVSGTVDSSTQKSLKAHVVGLTWPHGDPARDQKSVNEAATDIKRNGAEGKKKFEKAETECRAVADILKKQIAGFAAAALATEEKWTEMAKHCGEQATLKKDFEAAKDSHDLLQQKDILAKAKKVQEKIEKANATGYAKFEEMGDAVRSCVEAIERLSKLDIETKKTK